MSQTLTIEHCANRQELCQTKIGQSIDRILDLALASSRKSDAAECAVFEVKGRLDDVESIVEEHKRLVETAKGTLKKVLISSYTIAGTMIVGLASGYVMIFKFITSESGHQILKAVLQVSAK